MFNYGVKRQTFRVRKTRHLLLLTETQAKIINYNVAVKLTAVMSPHFHSFPDLIFSQGASQCLKVSLNDAWTHSAALIAADRFVGVRGLPRCMLAVPLRCLLWALSQPASPCSGTCLAASY